MIVNIEKGRAKGCVSAPPSKSMAHRLLICAALSSGESVIHGMSDCEDVRATLDCLSALGVPFEQKGDTVKIKGIDAREMSASAPLSCRESGSTLRFFVPLCMISGNNTMLTGAPQLMKRPMNVYEALAKEKGLTFSQDDRSVIVKGPLKSGEYKVAGNVSSQFISGLLFALPLVKGDSTINIIPPVESRSYIELTLFALREFGVEVTWKDDYTLFIKGDQTYKATETTVEGDYSGAAFFEAMNALGSDISVEGLREDSLQGDKVYSRYFEMLGKGTPTIHIGNCPDLGPVLFAVAAAKNGGIFTGTARLKIKESDRAAAMAEELKKFGVSVTIHDDAVVVYPLDFHKPTENLCGHNDHRIVMSLAVILTLTGGTIEGAEAISKSFPTFFEDIKSLGIEVRV